jgi:hypothetical protein
MPEFGLPVLGFSDWSPNPSCVQWKNGTVICRGILGGAFDPETLAAEQAERDRKDALRNHDNVVLLDDYR